MDDFEAMRKKALEIAVARRFERFKSNLLVSYRPISAAEKDTLLKDGGYAAPEAFVANAAETKDLNQVMAEDISIGGVRVSTSAPLEIHKELWVNLTIPEVPIPISTLCSVMWTRPVGEGSPLFSSGLRFDAINQNDMKKVEAFLQLQKSSAQPPARPADA
jgi:Tfp pilus assembly protein PilZ